MGDSAPTAYFKGRQIMKDIGLVFGGGGGKGAYQIGVWKAIREFGIDKNITAVSGTSVGALNAALYVNGDYETAEKIWFDLSEDKILTPKETIFEMLGEAAETILKDIDEPVRLVSDIVKKAGEGIWSRHGLEEIIDDHVSLKAISGSELKIFAGCTLIPEMKIKYFKLNGLMPSEIKKILIASSAIPVVFPNQKIGDDIYIDGGVSGSKGNIPIKPLYDEGYRNIIVVCLNEGDRIDRSLYDGAYITELYPQRGLGSFISGTLDFSSDGARKRLSQGYEDACIMFEKTADFLKG